MSWRGTVAMVTARKQAGLTLIELIIVIVVLAIGVVGIGAAFAYLSRSLALNDDLQRTWQVAHECADHVLGLARKPGTYASVPLGSPSTVCNGLPTDTGFTRTVNVTAMAGNSALCDAGAPSSWSCNRVQITVTRGSSSAVLNFMMVNY